MIAYIDDFVLYNQENNYNWCAQ